MRKVLTSAQRLGHYHHSLRTAGLHTTKALAELRSVEETLPRLSLFDGSFLPRPRESSRQCLPPIPRQSRILVANSHGDASVGQTGILAAPVSILLTTAVTVQHALIAFTGIREGSLSPGSRDLLWRKFRVPLFEQHLGPDGEVIAHECEAHRGLHILEENAAIESHEDELVLTSLTDCHRPVLRLKTGFVGQIERSACACGRTTPRILQLSAKA